MHGVAVYLALIEVHGSNDVLAQAQQLTIASRHVILPCGTMLPLTASRRCTSGPRAGGELPCQTGPPPGFSAQFWHCSKWTGHYLENFHGHAARIRQLCRHRVASTQGRIGGDGRKGGAHGIRVERSSRARLHTPTHHRAKRAPADQRGLKHRQAGIDSLVYASAAVSKSPH